MALIDELKERREAVANKLEDAYVSTETLRAELDDLDRAIDGLEQPQFVEPEFNEQKYRNADDAGYPYPEAFRAEPQPIPDEPELFDDEPAMIDGEQVWISDPAIEPESGLHGESVIEKAVEMTAEKLFNEHWDRKEHSDGLWPLSRQRPEIQEAWREKARELLAPPTPAVMEMMNEIIEEAPALNADMQDEREQGYAPVTDPEADFLARANDYYSPQAVAERNRLDLFRMFKREDA